jgi:hypothetical protein
MAKGESKVINDDDDDDDCDSDNDDNVLSYDYLVAMVLTVETRNNLRSASVRTYTFFTTG